MKEITQQRKNNIREEMNRNQRHAIFKENHFENDKTMIWKKVIAVLKKSSNLKKMSTIIIIIGKIFLLTNGSKSFSFSLLLEGGI